MPELTQEELDQLQEDLGITKFQLQAILDILEGGIRSTNMVEYRNTYVFNNHGVLDSTHDMIMNFELIDEMTKLAECKVSFKVENFNIGVKDI